MSKHTPGPWSVIKKLMPIGYAKYEVAHSEDGELVCDVVYEESDARLIAAAPELLSALQDCLETEERPKIKAKALAAIAKATGEQ